MFKRVLSSLIFTPLFLLLLFYLPEAYFVLFILGINIWAMLEFFQVVRNKGIKPQIVSAIVSVVFLYGIIFFWVMGINADRWGGDLGIGKMPLVGLAIMCACSVIVIGLGLVRVFRGAIRSSIFEMGATIFGILYTSLPFIFTLLIYKHEYGAHWIFLMMWVTWFYDIGAYFGGRYLGKHKLAPVLSPKKTIEGAVVGLLTSVVTVAIIIQIKPLFWGPDGFPIPLSICLILSVALSILGQLGDLIESVIKRDADVKDSGVSFTGHGGILDIIDSILINFPVVFILLVLLAVY
jgi:phosphatidate cytidylyltransferase